MQVVQTEAFRRSREDLGSIRAQVRLLVAVERMQAGNFGDSKPVGAGVFESRIHHGPGYRIYYFLRGESLVILLLCGAKSTQDADIRRAKLLRNKI